MGNKNYTELKQLDSFDERFDYLKLPGSVGMFTLGFDRYLGQMFYTSREWKSVRNIVILRDNGCDLGIEGYEIHGNVLVHHLNPVDVKSITHGDEWILDPEYLITTTHQTHNAIHYGSKGNLHSKTLVQRIAGDTKLW